MINWIFFCQFRPIDIFNLEKHGKGGVSAILLERANVKYTAMETLSCSRRFSGKVFLLRIFGILQRFYSLSP